jgi:flagellar hook protein FlgE
MFTSFSTALSALAAHSTAVDVVGNNLANLNTPGFKASIVSFQDLVTQSLGVNGGEGQAGFGVAPPRAIRQFTQGAIRSSSGDLDVAIQGDGFLVVRDRAGATQYTRGGYLQVDRAGNLMTNTGQQVLGWAESGGTVPTNGPISGIQVPVGSLRAPVATSDFSFDINLDAAATAGPPAPETFSSSIEVFDSLGSSHVVTVNFTKNATANVWDYAVSVPDTDVTSPIAPVTGSITFDSSGRLTDPPVTGPFPSINLTGLVDGAADQTLTWQIYNGTAPRLTQFTQPSSISANQQNGSATAQLVRVAIGDGGVVMAQYSNGEQAPVAQLAMASIRNPGSLTAVGNNSFQLGAATALPAIGLPGTGGRGNISGGAIENSTVDIAREFTNLIIFQRGFQANARVITTVDEMSQETIGLKR